MDVAADRRREKALLHRRFRGGERKPSASMADVEKNAFLARVPDVVGDVAVSPDDTALALFAKRMRNDVACACFVQKPLHGRIRCVDVHHHRLADCVAHLARFLEGVKIVRTGVVPSAADFYADDHLAVFLCRLERYRTVNHPRVDQFTGGADQPYAGNVDESEQTRAGGPDHRSAETVEAVASARP